MGWQGRNVSEGAVSTPTGVALGKAGVSAIAVINWEREIGFTAQSDFRALVDGREGDT